MTIKQVKDLLTDLKSDRIERTASFGEDELDPVGCAFSNEL